MSYSNYYDYKYVTVAQKQALAKKSIQKAAKKGIKYHPIIVAGNGTKRDTSSSWWGKAWNDNMEQYSDYANRLPRGKSCIRNGMVVDLQIHEGQVTGKVQGTSTKPYSVTITIDPLSKELQKKIQDRCEFGISSVEALVNGQFPKELQDLFTARDGLFPSPQEIHFKCSCPDGAHLCKHVAAIMYGIAVRLDEEPLLFFQLRGIDPQSLVEKVITNRLESMLENCNRPSERILDADISELFGI